MAIFVAARYARHMWWMRRGFGTAGLVLSACAFGCQSPPGGGAVATPIATPIRAAAAATATVAAQPIVDRAPESPLASPMDRRIVAAPPASLDPTPAPVTPPPATAAVGQPGMPYAGIPTAQPAAPRPPRAFRTPERSGDRAFVPPQGSGAATSSDGSDPPASAPNAAGQRATSGVVIFRASARTALEGFALRVSYPQSLGHFVATDHAAECTGAAGALVTANDTGKGELRLLVASAQALPFPFDVFCPFTVAPGQRLEAGAFQALVAEVVSDAKKADPALLLVEVAAR